MNQTNRETELFENLPVAKALRKMILPAMFGQIIVLIYNMADTFFLGQIDDPFMVAGTSLILPVFNLVIAIAGLTGVGGGTMISALLGVGEKEEARKVSAFSFYLSIGSALLFSLTAGLFMRPILTFLGASDNTYSFAAQYTFCVVVLGAVPTVLNNVLASMVRSVGLSKEAGFGITLGGVINIGLDALFMFVLFPRSSAVLAVGVATLISNCIACGYFFGIIRKNAGDSVLDFRPQPLPHKKNIKRLFIAGTPSAVNGLLFDIDYMVIDKLMSEYSDIALAAIGIVLKVERLPLNLGIGICQGMMPLIAYSSAAANQKRVDEVMKRSMKIGLTVAAASILLYQCFTPQIVRFFIGEPQTVALATVFLRIRILATPLMFLSFFTVYFFQSSGKGNVALFLSVMRWAVFNIPMLYILNGAIGVYGIVLSQITADVLTVLLSAYVYWRYRRG